MKRQWDQCPAVCHPVKSLARGMLVLSRARSRVRRATADSGLGPNQVSFRPGAARLHAAGSESCPSDIQRVGMRRLRSREMEPNGIEPVTSCLQSGAAKFGRLPVLLSLCGIAAPRAHIRYGGSRAIGLDLGSGIRLLPKHRAGPADPIFPFRVNRRSTGRSHLVGTPILVACAVSQPTTHLGGQRSCPPPSL